jgi:hypothetical protein
LISVILQMLSKLHEERYSTVETLTADLPDHCIFVRNSFARDQFRPMQKALRVDRSTPTKCRRSECRRRKRN